MHTPTTTIDAPIPIETAECDMRVAVLSDTHGLLRNIVLPLLTGCAHILHAGDVGDPDILSRLGEIAPVTAVRGNIDHSGPCAALPASELLSLCDTSIYLLHSIAELDIAPRAAGVRLVISGHSHKPALEERGDVTYLNPGSIGPRRFTLPISLAFLTFRGGDFHVEFLTLPN